MRKVSKAKLLIIGLYIICLLLYILMLHITNHNIEKWDNMFKKLKIEQAVNMDSFTFLHIHLSYFIISTYDTLKYLNVSIINKIPRVIIYIIAFILILIGAFKYYQVKYYSTMIAITGLLFFIIRTIGDKISEA